MKVKTAKKMESIYKKSKSTASRWFKSGNGYVFQNDSIFIGVGEFVTDERPMRIIETAGAVSLGQCHTEAVPDKQAYSIPKEQLKGTRLVSLGTSFFKNLEAVRKLITKDSLRNYGTVALINIEPDCVTLVGTDSFALIETKENVSQDEKTQFCLPVQAIDTLLLFKNQLDGIATLSEGNDAVTFSFYDIVICIRCSQVTYPKYKSAMLSRVKKSGTISLGKIDAPKKTHIKLSQEKIEWRTNDKVSRTLNEIPHTGITGSFDTVCLNQNYLNVIAENAKKLPITWQSEDSDGPLCFLTTKDKVTIRSVIVPIRYKHEELEKMRA